MSMTLSHVGVGDQRDMVTDGSTAHEGTTLCHEVNADYNATAGNTRVPSARRTFTEQMAVDNYSNFDDPPSDWALPTPAPTTSSSIEWLSCCPVQLTMKTFHKTAIAL